MACPFQANYVSARSACEANRGHLMTLPDNATQAAVVGRLQDMSESYQLFLGLTREGEGWMWINGK